MPTFPVDLRAWLGCLIMQQQTFDLGEGLTVQNRTAGGQVLRSGGAERLWRGSLSLKGRRNDDARALQAKLHALRGPGASFWIGDLTWRGANFAATLGGVQANGTVNITGAPPLTVIRQGSYIAFTYNGIRAFHQIMDSPGGWFINSSGVRNGIEVVPPVRPGWTAGAAVAIGAPNLIAVVVPGTLQVGTSGRLYSSGASFDWVQLLRSAA